MRLQILPFALFFILPLLQAQPVQLDLAKKNTTAVRTLQGVRIDGVLDEDDWRNAPATTDFVQNQPNPGEKSSFPTEVKILFDNNAFYVGATMYDPRPDSLMMELSQRDQLGNTEWFGIFLDAYRDGINGFGFVLTPAEVQFDAKYSTFGEDENWDAVWEGSARVTKEGWVAEIKIPYSAIRFPDVSEQTWGINFGRMIRRKQEKGFWSEVDPQKNGFLNQAGHLKGLENIKSPVRLQATPFLAVYGEHYYDKNASRSGSFGRSINGGMDIKYGISDAFTLDMTLVPDFGEARSDNQILNLSPFEVQFVENRQFFTEGTELFNKGGLFYSRRIGGTPLHHAEVSEQLGAGEEIAENPQQSQLYNATKISGRTNKGLGIGFFNATSGRTTAVVRDPEGGSREIQTDPLTNYNVLVLDQNLKNNSFITLINTSVLRSGSDYDANVTGTVFTLRNKKNSYALQGEGAVSQKYFPGQTDLGHNYDLTFRKTSGNFFFGVEYEVLSDTYDPNDLGFLNNNNERSWELWFEYGKFKPFGQFNRAFVGMWTQYNRLYSPDHYTNFGIEAWGFAQTKGFWALNVFTYHEPTETYDFFEPRTKGRFYRAPARSNYGFYLETDSRKRFRIFVNPNYTLWNESGRKRYSLSLGPRFRVNDRLNFQFNHLVNRMFNDIGFASSVDPVEGSETPTVIFGRRDRTTVENELGVNYNFTSKMAITFRLRHYWSKVEYNRFNTLLEDGTLGPTDFAENRDQDYDAFNIDLIYRWRFAPGSDVFLVWKNAVYGFEEITSPNYFRNTEGLFNNPVSNSLSLKVIYFLDYFSLTNKEHK